MYAVETTTDELGARIREKVRQQGGFVNSSSGTVLLRNGCLYSWQLDTSTVHASRKAVRTCGA